MACFVISSSNLHLQGLILRTAVVALTWKSFPTCFTYVKSEDRPNNVPLKNQIKFPSIAATFYLGSSSTTQFHPRTFLKRVLVAMIPIYFCTTKHKNSHNFFFGVFSHFKVSGHRKTYRKASFQRLQFSTGKSCTFREIGVRSSCMSCGQCQSSPLCGIQAVSFLSF